MKPYSAAIAIAILTPVFAQTADVQTVLAKAREHVETVDYRVNGRLVRVEADGTRTSYNLAIKAHWFREGLRVQVEISQPQEPQRDMHILLEMRPRGQNLIQIAHPGDTAATTLPFEKWGDSPVGDGFSFEDLLEQQYFWKNQTLAEPGKYGARDCDVLNSVPGEADRTHYAEVRTWLDHTIGFPVYAEKTLRKSGSVKEFTYFGLRQFEGVWSAHQVEVKLRGQPGSMLLIIDRGSPKAHLSLDDFSLEQFIHFQGRP